MNKLKPIIIPFILSITILMLIWSYKADTTTYVSAYPHPTAVAPLSGYPVGTSTPPPPTPELSNVTLSGQSYLPVLHNQYDWKNTRFSVAGLHTRNGSGVQSLLNQVVPPALQIDPYVWDTLPNPESNIQVIRSCVYYRQKEYKQSFPPHNIVFKEWYQQGRVGNLCWDPITEQIAVVTNHANCPYQQNNQGEVRPCLNIEIEDTSISNTALITFQNIIQDEAYKHNVWLIGNEPDNFSQDALLVQLSITDNSFTRTVDLGPSSYAIFFKEMYDLIDAHNGSAPPKLVFCQATYAQSNRTNQGTQYCQQAFHYFTETLKYGAEHIYALSTHQYMHDSMQFQIEGTTYSNGQLLDGNTSITGTNFTVLERAIVEWENYLKQFENWAESVGMGDKPLWLTEYGSLNAKICPDIATHVNDCPSEAYIFYGNTNYEGIWGMQMGQMEYLMRNDNQWQAAWWFSAIMGDWDGTPGCDMTIWLWGDNEDCLNGRNNLSSAGRHHYEVIDCLYYDYPCTITETTYIIPDPNLPLLGEPYCKATADYLCVSPNTIAPPTPTPTPLPTATPISSCGCDNNTLAQCPQVVCLEDS